MKDKKEIKHLVVRIPRDFHNKVKMAALRADMSLGDFVIEALKNALKSMKD